MWLITSHQKIQINWMKKHRNSMLRAVHHHMVLSLLNMRKVSQLKLRKGHVIWYRQCENKVLRRIFGAKKKEVTGAWRKLCKENLPNFYSSSDIVREIISRMMR
jgi:hypothetical protein